MAVDILNSFVRYKTIAFLALFFWLLGNWMGTHGHFCFDGQEPPISIHMDMIGGHPEHATDEHHQDADVDLVQLVIAKLNKIDHVLILLTTLWCLLVITPQQLFISFYRRLLPSSIAYWHPLLRAPPLTT